MNPTFTPQTSRPRLTVRRVMAWVLIAALVLGFLTTLDRGWPFRGWLGGGVNLGILVGILYLPVLPALVVWQKRIMGRPSERSRRVVIVLVLCYLAWLGALVATFQAIFSSIGF